MCDDTNKENVRESTPGEATAMKTIEAVYERGTFRPLEPVAPNLHEGQRVRLVVEGVDATAAYLEMVTHVLDGLSEDDRDALEDLTRRRAPFFPVRP
jgi:predicted DNA-binding antitoxin AbrB/MazE fold protein